MKEMDIRLEKTRLESGISESYLSLAQKTERQREREKEREREIGREREREKERESESLNNSLPPVL